MISRTVILSLLLAYAEARFGQEQVPIAAISAVQGGAPGAAATIAGAAISDLLGGANACDKLKRGDQILAELGTGADAVAAAKAFVGAEKNFNPFNNPAIPTICSDPTLPANAALRGILPLIDPAVDGAAAINALAAQSLNNPVAANGKSVADLLTEAGFTNFTPQAAAGGAAGGNAGQNNGQNGNAGKQNGQNGNAGKQNGQNGQNGQAGKQQNGAQKNNGKGKAVLEGGAANNATAGAGGAKNQGKGKGKAVLEGGAANNATVGAGKAKGRGKANADCPAVATVTVTVREAAGATAAASTTAAAAAPPAATEKPAAEAGNQNKNQGKAGNAGNANAGKNAGGANNNAGGAAQKSSIAGLDFGRCVPTISFEGGRANRAANEFTFLPTDPLVAQGQQEALNPNIITNRVCDQLTNVCQANDAAKAACKDAQAQILALGTRDQATADKFNELLGFAGAAGAAKRSIRFRA